MSANDKGYMNRSEATDTHLKKNFYFFGAEFSSVLARADPFQPLHSIVFPQVFVSMKRKRKNGFPLFLQRLAKNYLQPK